MRLLINGSYILPVSEDMYNNNPIGIFDVIYSDSSMHLVQTFPEWISGFIENQHSYLLSSLDELETVKKIHSILSSNVEIKKLSYQLFPYQFEMTYSNWENIKDILQLYIFQKKGTEDFKFSTFAENNEFFTNHVNTPISI